MSGKAIQQSVLPAKHGRGTHYCCLGEDASGYLLASTFSAEELRCRLRVGIVGRYMNESINIILSTSLGNALRAFDVYVLVVKIPVRVSWSAENASF